MALPEGYEPPKGASRYMKFEKGSNKFQVLFKPGTAPYIWGYQVYTIGDDGKKKPVRNKDYTKLPPGVAFDGVSHADPTFFWAMAVWRFSDNKVCILQFDKRSIQKQLEEFMMTEEWDNITNMSIEVKRTGEGRETRYVVIPMPKKKVPVEVQKEFESLNIDLTALYEGGTPFKEPGAKTNINVELTEEEFNSIGSEEDFERATSEKQEISDMVDDIIG